MVERLVRDARWRCAAKRGEKGHQTRLLDAVLQRTSNFFGALPANANGGRVPLPAEAIPEGALFASTMLCRAVRLVPEPTASTRERPANRAGERTNFARRSARSKQPGQVSWAQASGRSPAVGSSPIDVGPCCASACTNEFPAWCSPARRLRPAGTSVSSNAASASNARSARSASSRRSDTKNKPPSTRPRTCPTRVRRTSRTRRSKRSSSSFECRRGRVRACRPRSA